MKALLLATAVFLLPISAYAQTQAEMNQQVCGETASVDAQLDTLYKKIVKQYSYDKVFLKYLETSQKAWLAYRDAELKALYPSEYRLAYGSMGALCDCRQQERLTLERIKELNQWLQGTGADQACHGTIRIQ